MRVRQRTRAAVLGLLALSWTSVHASGLVPPSEAPDVALVYTGDVIGYLDPCG